MKRSIYARAWRSPPPGKQKSRRLCMGEYLHDLASLTDALPDGTWLSDLSLKSGELMIDGQSSNSARLITLLSAIPLFPQRNSCSIVWAFLDRRAGGSKVRCSDRSALDQVLNL